MEKLICLFGILFALSSPLNAQTWEQTRAAIDAGLRTRAQDCNKFLQAVANQLGLKAFDGKTADQIAALLASSRRSGKLTGWKIAGGNYTVENAFDRAQLGDLVIGVIDSQTRNAVKPRGDKTNYTHGHVFIIVAPKRGNVRQWRDLDIANAGIGNTPQERTARIMKGNLVMRSWEQPHVKFYNLVK
ncbi:MAG TPA: hypothetical protein VE999_07190 [Gemmataceae bacterium]|nr:hypothetical protein [Gemmataceae bacterium]